MNARIGAISAALLLLCFDCAVAAPPSYSIADLGDLVGSATIFTSHGSTAFDINNFGQVSGSSSTVLPNGNGGPVHAFLWTPDTPNGATGRMIDISPGSLGIDEGDTVRINDFGQALFTSGSSNPAVQRQPVLWTPAARNGTTGTAAPLLGITSDGFGLNKAGQVVGRMFPGLCFAWTPNLPNGSTGSINHHFDAARAQDIPGYGFGACTNAVAINDFGEVTGTVGVGFWSRPFVHVNPPVSFPNVGPLELGAIDLGEIVGPGPNANPNDQTWNGGGIAINNAGHVAGSSVFPGVGVHPSLFDGTSLKDVAPLTGVPGAANGINENDQVVGRTAFQTPGGGAFLYDRGITYQLLNLIEAASKSGWTALDAAYAINDRGQIVGAGVHDGQLRAFLATPVAVACALDVTSHVKVKAGGFMRVGLTSQFRQVVTLTNTGAAVPGPISLAIDDLSGNAAVADASGTTGCAAPAGRPYINIAGPLGVGASASLLVVFSDPSLASITYTTTRVLAGTDPR